VANNGRFTFDGVNASAQRRTYRVAAKSKPLHKLPVNLAKKTVADNRLSSDLSANEVSEHNKLVLNILC